MFIGTVDEMIAIMELERDRLGGDAPVRMMRCFNEGTCIPFVTEAHLKKDGSHSGRKTAQPCVMIGRSPK